MQRLSLDSSVSKLHIYGGRKDDTYDIDALKPKDSVYSHPSPSSSAPDYDDHEIKDIKARRLSLQSPFATTTHQKKEKLIHFIPILTLICFIILYLSSHAPSQSDMAQFNGFIRPKKYTESEEQGAISGFISADALSIRNGIRNLQVTEHMAAISIARRRTSHRKTGDF